MATAARQIERAWVEEQTLEILSELLRELGSAQALESLSLDSALDRDLGLGSLERVEVLVRCEGRFQVRLPDQVAQQAQTPAEWVRAILESGVGAAPEPARYRITPPAREAPPAPDSATTLVEVLRRHLEIEPDRVHIHLPEDETGQDITYRELFERASEAAAGLAAAGLGRNETVALMLPTSADFFYAFFGVILAGGIPVPIYPPARPDKIEEYARRQVSILRNAGVRFLITFERVKGLTQLMRPSLPGLLDVTTVAALRQAGAGCSFQPVEAADTGFIQYTSGSTGDPKGVVLTHANILANVRGIGHAVRVRPVDVVVTWLPLYHDMGLIGSWLFALHYATPITVLSPQAFLSRPERWLWALHDARGTLCPAPNFAYELCARKIPEAALEGLDLSAWRVAINAGEAVLPETLERFTARFAPYGFRPQSWVPCYGLAESSVALAFPPVDRLPRIDTIRRESFEKEGLAVAAAPQEPHTVRFVSAGSPIPQHEVRLVDAQGRPVGERRQGRLLFRGPSRTSGYYRNAPATAAVLGPDGWMDSGDLAYRAGGELFVTGRVKDCIIKAGRNLLPQEVEEAASEAPGVRRGCVAAFGAPDPATGTERLVVVAETRARSGEELRRIEADILRNVDRVVGLPPDKVQLVSPQIIPKTSSGKIQRSQTRDLFLAGKLEARRAPPWLQMARLGVASGAAWAGLALRRAGAALRQLHASSVLLIVSGAAGGAARLAPGWGLRAWLLRLASRAFFALSRHGLEAAAGTRPAGRPVVLVANRAGRVDALAVAAAWGEPCLLADATALAGLPPTVAQMLEPFVLGKQNLRRALEQGRSVLVFPESPSGEPAHRCRFRLDAFHAAVETGAAVLPVLVAGTSHILESARHPALRKKARIVVGEAIPPPAGNQRQIVELRDRVREALDAIPP